MDWYRFYGEDVPVIKPYGIEHIIYLIVCAIVIFLFIKKRKYIEEKKGIFSKIFLYVLLFQQVVLMYGWYAIVTGFNVAEALPLHICRVASLLTIVWLVTKDNRFMDVIFLFSVYALGSLFYPKDVNEFWHIQGISYMINHLITVLMPMFAVFAFGWRPKWSGFLRAVISLTILVWFDYFLNPIVGGNYFYLTRPPFFKALTYTAYTVVTYFCSLAIFVVVMAILDPKPFVLKVEKLFGVKSKED